MCVYIVYCLVQRATLVYSPGAQQMTTTEGRFWVKLISGEALAQYMTHRGFTVRTLATKVGCSHSLIGHLRSGKRSTCMPVTAKAIEKALDAPVGSLFVPRVSNVSRDAQRIAS